MTKPRSVTIDGVEYVPAVSITGISGVLETLALQYHTPDTLKEYGTGGLSIIVTDTEQDDGGETFQQFAARLATHQAENLP